MLLVFVYVVRLLPGNDRRRTSTNTNSTVLMLMMIYISIWYQWTQVIINWKFNAWWIDWYIGCVNNLYSSLYINVIIVVCCCLSEDSKILKKIFLFGKVLFFPYKIHCVIVSLNSISHDSNMTKRLLGCVVLLLR